MVDEAKRLSEQRHQRIRRVKRVLRWMPRPSSMHRYPVLRWFKSLAQKRPEIWSFRVKRVVPALYAGFIVAFLPLYGIQLPLSILLAWLIRVNLPIFFSLQLISNPLTILPLYFACFQIGRIGLNLLGVEVSGISIQEMNQLILQVSEGSVSHQLNYLWKIWWITAAGGLVLGTFLGSVAAGVYKLAAYEVTLSYNRLKVLQSHMHHSATHQPENSPNDSSKPLA